MVSSTANQLTSPANQSFFLSPQFPLLQRQYEALRAFLVDEEPSGDVARRFGYSPASSASFAISFATILKNALPSSACHIAVLNPRPPATAFGSWR